MSMMEEIEKMMNGVDASINFRVVNIGGKKLYIEGIKSVVNIGEDEMLFQMKNGTLSVSGNNLKVKYLDKTTCIIEGTIKVVGEK